MKKFLLLFFLFPFYVTAQYTVIDSVVTQNCLYYEEDTVQGSSIDSISYLYDANGNLISRTSILTTGIPGNYVVIGKKDSVIYDSTAHSVTTLSGPYSNGVFAPNFGIVLIYDSLDRVSVKHFINGSLQPTTTYTYYYFPNNEIDRYFTNEYLNGNPIDSQLHICSYDASWNLVQDGCFDWYNGAIYRPYDKQLLYYDTQNNLIAYNYYLWIDSVTGYDPTCYLDTAWFIYDSINRLIEQNHRWCGGGGNREFYIYDQNGLLDSVSHWGQSSMGSTNASDCWCTYYLNTGFDRANEEITFEVYPNPASEMLNVKLKNLTRPLEHWRIIDLTGRIVLSGNLKTSSFFRINISELSGGVYILSLDKLDHSQLFIRQ